MVTNKSSFSTINLAICKHMELLQTIKCVIQVYISIEI